MRDERREGRAGPGGTPLRGIGLAVVLALLVGTALPDAALAQEERSQHPPLAAAPVAQAQQDGHLPASDVGAAWTDFHQAVVQLREALQRTHDAKTRGGDLERAANDARAVWSGTVLPALAALERAGVQEPRVRQLIDAIVVEWNCPLGTGGRRTPTSPSCRSGANQVTNAVRHADALLALARQAAGAPAPRPGGQLPTGPINRIGDPAQAAALSALLTPFFAYAMTPGTVGAMEKLRRVAVSEVLSSSGAAGTSWLGQVEGRPLDPRRTYCAPVGCLRGGRSAVEYGRIIDNLPAAFALGAPSGYAVGAANPDWVRRFGRGGAGGVGALINFGGAVVGTSVGLFLPSTTWRFTPSAGGGPAANGLADLTGGRIDRLDTQQGHLRNNPDVATMARNAGFSCVRDAGVAAVYTGGNPAAALTNCTTSALGGVVAADELRLITYVPATADQLRDQAVPPGHRPPDLGGGTTPGGYGGYTERTDSLPSLRFGSYTVGQAKRHEELALTTSIRVAQLQALERQAAVLPGRDRTGIDPGEETTRRIGEELAALRSQDPVGALRRLSDEMAAAQRGARNGTGPSHLIRVTAADGWEVYQTIGDDSHLPLTCDGKPIPGPFVLNRSGCPEPLQLVVPDAPSGQQGGPAAVPAPADAASTGATRAAWPDGGLTLPAMPQPQAAEASQPWAERLLVGLPGWLTSPFGGRSATSTSAGGGWAP